MCACVLGCTCLGVRAWVYWVDVLGGCIGWMYWVDVLGGCVGVEVGIVDDNPSSSLKFIM